MMMMIMMMRLFQAHLPPAIFSHYTTPLQPRQKRMFRRPRSKPPGKCGSLGWWDRYEPGGPSTMLVFMRKVQIGGWSQEMMLDIPFSMYLNYVQDQVYNLTWLLFDVYLASSVNSYITLTTYLKYSSLWLRFFSQRSKQPWVFNLQAPEHLKLCWWWCQQEWQPWNRFFSKVVGCKNCLSHLSLKAWLSFLIRIHSHTHSQLKSSLVLYIYVCCVYILMHVWGVQRLTLFLSL